MKQHLIVLDLDGTLLTDQKVISDKTKSTLTKAQEQGHDAEHCHEDEAVLPAAHLSAQP